MHKVTLAGLVLPAERLDPPVLDTTLRWLVHQLAPAAACWSAASEKAGRQRRPRGDDRRPRPAPEAARNRTGCVAWVASLGSRLRRSLSLDAASCGLLVPRLAR
jgi:hypothetical protein